MPITSTPCGSAVVISQNPSEWDGLSKKIVHPGPHPRGQNVCTGKNLRSPTRFITHVTFEPLNFEGA